MYLVTASGEELSVKFSILINIRSANKLRKDLSCLWIDHHNSRHVLISKNSAFLVDDSKSLGINIASSNYTAFFPVIPSIIRYFVGHLNISPVFPFDIPVGIMKDSQALMFSLCVLFKCRLAMTIGKWFLNMHVLNIEWIIPRIFIENATKSIITKTIKFSNNFVTISVVVWFDIRESHTRNVVKWRTDIRGPILTYVIWKISTTCMVLELFGDE
mmetsp:Transcript_37707/g.87829  ORF Transcript_37707/g.87829 Transcript_37707/m.87829 type:complete len:215 (-) Transcript_37707:133-777(-)